VLLTWLVYAVAFWLTAKVVPGFRVQGLVGAVVAAAIFGLLNYALGQVFFVLLGIATLGIGFLLAFLTRWIVNAILLRVAAALTPRLEIKSFGTAFVAGLVISLLASAGEWILTRALHAHPIWT
jgi:putative membrane protein